jgi:hypothetical protein
VDKPFGKKEFRAELEKLLPGYRWTVHQDKPYRPDVMEATGTVSSGSNRLSTIGVERSVRGAGPWYTVRSAGYGRSGPWDGEYRDASLASAVRGLQDHYEAMRDKYSRLAQSIECGRKAEAVLRMGR